MSAPSKEDKVCNDISWLAGLVNTIGLFGIPILGTLLDRWFAMLEARNDCDF